MVGLLSKISNSRLALILVYCMYICIFTRCLNLGACYALGHLLTRYVHSLAVIERQAFRLCLGLPKFVAIKVLYLEARLPSFATRFSY